MPNSTSIDGAEALVVIVEQGEVLLGLVLKEDLAREGAVAHALRRNAACLPGGETPNALNVQNRPYRWTPPNALDVPVPGSILFEDEHSDLPSAAHARSPINGIGYRP